MTQNLRRNLFIQIMKINFFLRFLVILLEFYWVNGLYMIKIKSTLNWNIQNELNPFTNLLAVEIEFKCQKIHKKIKILKHFGNLNFGFSENFMIFKFSQTASINVYAFNSFWIYVFNTFLILILTIQSNH